MKKNRGNIIVEASIVLPVVMVGIGIMLYLFFLVYQKMQVSIIANDSAAAISRVYVYDDKDPFDGYMTKDNFRNPNLYRMFEQDLKDKAMSKAEWYGYYCLNKNRLIKATNTNVTAEFETSPGKAIVKRIKVNITEEYKVPLAGFFGINNKVKFSGVGYADCNDLLDYMNTVDMIWEEVDENNISLDTTLIQIIKDIFDFGGN